MGKSTVRIEKTRVIYFVFSFRIRENKKEKLEYPGKFARDLTGRMDDEVNSNETNVTNFRG